MASKGPGLVNLDHEGLGEVLDAELQRAAVGDLNDYFVFYLNAVM